MIKKMTATAALMLTAATAQAEERGTWYAQGGFAHVSIPDSDNVSIGGAQFPGGGSEFSSDNTLTLGLGYYFHENVSALIIGGIPPETEVTGTGTLAGIPVGSLKYAPFTVYVNYHIPTKSNWKPFIGAGLVYNFTFDIQDAAITNLDVDNSFGFALRAGVEYQIDDNWGAYVSYAQSFVSHTATGNAPAFGGAPVEADVDLDPSAVEFGISYRF